MRVQLSPARELQKVIENFITEQNIDPEDIIWCPKCNKFTVAETHLRADGLITKCYDGHTID